MSTKQLKLKNQLCFPVYAASRLITREYQPFLDTLGLTYPQYLVLLVLWESNGITVNEIAHTLVLNTNTVTPLLKRMEVMGIIERRKSSEDERKVHVYLTEKGKEMEQVAGNIPLQLLEKLEKSTLSHTQLMELREQLNELIHFMKSPK